MPTYRSYLDLESSSIGKFVVCFGKDEYSLYGVTKEFPELDSKDIGFARGCLLRLARDHERAAKFFGLHKQIECNGNAIGGALIMVHRGVVYIAGESKDIGPVDIEDVKLCLPGYSVEQVD